MVRAGRLLKFPKLSTGIINASLHDGRIVNDCERLAQSALRQSHSDMNLSYTS